MKTWQHRGSAGDTIVEVMIVLAVLSFAFGISYATASHGLAQARNAEEHSEALGLLNSQIEMVRSYFVTQPDTTPLTGSAYDFCMTNSAAPTPTPLVNTGTGTKVKVPAIPSQDVLDGPNGNYPAACINSFYHESIDYNIDDPTNPYFDFRIRWDGAGTLGLQQEELTYKIFPGALLNGASDNIGVGVVGSPLPPPPPPPPPSAPPFNWSTIGNGFASCVHDSSDPLVGDGNDGCDPDASPPLPASSSSSEFSRRGVDIVYSLAAINILAGGNVTMTINYNQYAGAGTTPPAGYGAYRLNVEILSIGGGKATLIPGGVNLPIASDASSHNATSQTFTSIDIPADDPTGLELDWTNNTGIDPDLQINSITLSRP